jgi:hypothetical protein
MAAVRAVKEESDRAVEGQPGERERPERIRSQRRFVYGNPAVEKPTYSNGEPSFPLPAPRVPHNALHTPRSVGDRTDIGAEVAQRFHFQVWPLFPRNPFGDLPGFSRSNEEPGVEIDAIVATGVVGVHEGLRAIWIERDSADAEHSPRAWIFVC